MDSTVGNSPVVDISLGRRFIKYTATAAAAFILVACGSAWFHARYMVCQNLTESLPQHFFLVAKGTVPHRGDFLAFAVSGNAHQYPAGTVFIKEAIAEAGDTVSHKGNRVYVDGVYRGIIKAKGRKGFPLAPGPTGVIPAGHYFAWTPHPDSYDSRYADIGFPGLNSGVIGRAYPIF